MATLIMRLSQTRDGVFHAARSIAERIALVLLALFAVAARALGLRTDAPMLVFLVGVPAMLAPLAAHLTSLGGVPRVTSSPPPRS